MRACVRIELPPHCAVVGGKRPLQGGRAWSRGRHGASFCSTFSTKFSRKSPKTCHFGTLTIGNGYTWVCRVTKSHPIATNVVSIDRSRRDLSIEGPFVEIGCAHGMLHLLECPIEANSQGFEQGGKASVQIPNNGAFAVTCDREDDFRSRLHPTVGSRG